MSELKKSTRTMADLLAGCLEVTADGVVVPSADAFQKTLEGTDLDIETVKKVQKHCANVAIGFETAVGEKSIEVFGKHEDVQHTNVVIDLGEDVAEVNVRRHVPSTKPDDTKNDRYCVTTLAYRVQGAEESARERRNIRKHLQMLAAATLAK